MCTILIFSILLACSLQHAWGVVSFDSFLLEAMPPIKDLSLINATSVGVLQSLHNGTVVDLASVGNSLNIRIELQAIYSARVDVDIDVIHEVNDVVVGNYSLQRYLVFPSEETDSTTNSSIGSVATLAMVGSHRAIVKTSAVGEDRFVSAVVDWLVFDSRTSDVRDGLISIGITLIDATRDIPISELSQGETVFLNELPSDHLSLRANVDHSLNETIESVSFLYAKNQSKEEYMLPYALGGDINGDYKSVDWLFEEGQKAVTIDVLFTSGRVETSVFTFWVVKQSRAPELSGSNTSSTAGLATFGDDVSLNGPDLPKEEARDPTNLQTSAPIVAPVSPPPSQKPTSSPQSSAPTSRRPTPVPIVAPVRPPSQEPTNSPKTSAPTSRRPPIASATIGENEEGLNNPISKGSMGVEITGEMRVWHKLTLAFLEGPMTSETSTPNPFTDYRLDVTFVNGDKRYVVPGYFAADGDAANSGASSGNVWHCHFSPTQQGEWAWSARFVTGSGAATSADTSSMTPTHFDGTSGSFNIIGTSKTGRDFRGKGLLKYVDEHHLQFAETGEWFLKAGSDSPENFLAYEDFDNTGVRSWSMKTWEPHVRDYKAGDPSWRDGKGKGIIGAINYLASEGMNAFSFLTFSLGGDDKNVYPHISESDMLRIDVSKTAQWEVVLEHGDKMGMFMHFKTQETENDHLLDGGELGPERKLYYRELIARFGHHLAMNWNIGEENTNSEAQRKAFADFFSANDPYDHPVVIHTYIGDQSKVFGQLYGYPSYDGASIQARWDNVFKDTLARVQDSRSAGRPWIVSNDEQGHAHDGVVPDSVNAEHDNIRAQVLWGNIMAGGAGVEYYFGYGHDNSDLTCEDFRSRANMWRQSRYALEFFQKFGVPFQSMSNANGLISGDNWCLAERGNGSTLVLYLPSGGTADLDLLGLSSTTFALRWYDPRNGGALQLGSVKSITKGSSQSIGFAPNNRDSDWVVLVRCEEC